jgi:isopentenyldiphosphate isomerase
MVKELGLVSVVDKEDKEIKTIDRGIATTEDILRVTGIFIINEKGEILLQLRSKNSFRYPSYWDCTGGGHVDLGEDYETCANRELFEETGIKTELEFLGKYYIELDDGRKHFMAFYKGDFKGEIKIDPNEVYELKFFSINEIKKMISNKDKIHPECLFGLKKFFL